MRRGARRILKLLAFLTVLAAGAAVFWYVRPDLARRSVQAAREFWESPQVRGFFWPKKQSGRFSVIYDPENISTDYVDSILRIAETSENLLQELLGRSYVHDIRIYVFTMPGRHYIWTNGESEIHLCFEDKNDLLPPGMGGDRNHVAEIAHALALLVAQIRSGGAETPLPNDRATESLATYLEMNILVPGLWQKEKELLWPAPYDYLHDSGPADYARYASNPPQDMQAGRFWSQWDTFWFRLDKAGGPETVGKVLDRAGGPVGHIDVDELARAVEEVTGKKDLAQFVRSLPRG